MDKPTLPNPVDYITFAGQDLKPPRFYAYVMAGDGIFKWAVTDTWEASLPLSCQPIAGLPPWPRPFFRMVRPAPMHYLAWILKDARSHGFQEQMYHVRYDHGGWSITKPSQVYSQARVGYETKLKTPVVMDIHSHHGMPAYFSPTDDADEKGCRIYGVLGTIFTQPELALRVGVWGDYAQLKMLDVFEVQDD